MGKTGIVDILENTILNSHLPRAVPEFHAVSETDFQIFIPHHTADERERAVFQRNVFRFFGGKPMHAAAPESQVTENNMC